MLRVDTRNQRLIAPCYGNTCEEMLHAIAGYPPLTPSFVDS